MQNYTVGILRNYTSPDLGRQTSACSHEWNGVRFLLDDINEPCDVVVVLNDISREITVECREIWLIVQEPPVSSYLDAFDRYSHLYDRVYCPKMKGFQENCYASHGALPWHVSVSYNQAKQLAVPEKRADLSWVTSNKNCFPGHKDRLEFLGLLNDSNINFDLYGRGFSLLEDKFEGLAPYRYSLAVENFSGPDYWTEKIADCFLSWTMPIYYGCTNIGAYFPEGSFVQIDITKPFVIDQIRNVLASDRAEKNRGSIAEARMLVLEKYQLFPFIVDRITVNKQMARRKLVSNQNITSGSMRNRVGSLINGIGDFVELMSSGRCRK